MDFYLVVLCDSRFDMFLFHTTLGLELARLSSASFAVSKLMSIDEDKGSKLILTVNKNQQVLPWNIPDGKLQNPFIST